MSARRAISPVIAEVILVAVAIAIAIAVAGWLFGLWGGLASGTPQVQVSTATAFTNGSVVLFIVNTGSGADTLLRIDVSDGVNTVGVNTFTYLNGTAWDGVIKANDRLWIRADTGNTYTAGQTLTIKLYFEKSGTVTIPVTVQG